MPTTGGRAWRALLTPAWLVGHALALAVVVSFSGFGAWQFDRHGQRIERNAVIEERLAEDPVSLQQALEAAARERARQAAAGLGSDVDPLDYRRVRVSGRFLPSLEVLRRPVSRDGVPGYHVVTPLLLADGSAVLVERGWVPQEFDQVPVEAAPPPAGEVTLDAWAFPGQTPPTGPLAALAPRDPPEGRLTQVAYIDVERLAGQVPYPLQPLRLLLDEAPGAPAEGGLPLLPPPPALTLGPHLGYALQWYAFVVITVVGYGALLRRRLLEAAAAPTGS